MIWTGKISQAVKNILERNMGLRCGETLLIITDTPSIQEWRSNSLKQLEDMILRNLLARNITDVARLQFPKSSVVFQTYSSVERNSAEPEKDIEESMKRSDVVLALTTYSISYTDARESATKSGTRIASMPSVLAEMFYRKGSLRVDYKRLASETLMLAKTLTEASRVKIFSKNGTYMSLNLEGRQGIADTGFLDQPGSWGNLPAGEAYLAPLEGAAEGVVVIERSWFPMLKNRMKMRFREGQLVEISGGGDIGEELKRFIKPSETAEPHHSRGNLAEFGIGTNPNAKRRDNILEAEKIKGTIHLALGDNSHIGGNVKADYHQDFIIPSPTVEVDGKMLMVQGRLKLKPK